MDFLNKAYAQASDLFTSLTPGARMMAVLLLIVTVVSTTFLFNQQTGGADVFLMGGEMFSPAELREMEAAFGKANLSGYQVEGGRIKAPRGQQSQYMAALADAGAMPAEFGDFMKKAATNNSFIPPSRMQQEALTKSNRNHELQLILNRMRGIDKCAVQIDEKTERGTSRLYDQTLITASVSVQTIGNRPLDEMQVSTIRGLVASSVAGMKPQAVAVIDLSNGRLFCGTPGGDTKPAGAIGDYTDNKKRHENEWQQKISHVLSYIPGVLVTTNVELDPEVVHEQKSTRYESPDNVAARTGEGSQRPVESPPTDIASVEHAPLSTEPRAIHQPGVRRPAVSDRKIGELVPLAPEKPQKALPTSEKYIVREGRTPQRVTVSVAVPSGYYDRIWRQQHAGQADAQPDPAELQSLQETERKKIETIVATLLPIPTGKTSESYPQVTVSTFFQVPEPPLPVQLPQDQVLAWLNQHWTTLGLIALAFLSLLMLRGMVKALPTAATARPAPATFEIPDDLAQVAAESTLEPPSDLAWSRPRRAPASAAALREELADIVRDDPNAAVGILRTWIGNAN